MTNGEIQPLDLHASTGRGRPRVVKTPINLKMARTMNEKLYIGNCGEALALYHFRTLGWHVSIQTGSGDTIDMHVYNPDKKKSYSVSVKSTKTINPSTGRWRVGISQSGIPFDSDSYDFLCIPILPEKRVLVYDAKDFEGLYAYEIDKDPGYILPEVAPELTEEPIEVE